jgi:SAM-dependent methyltransferase
MTYDNAVKGQDRRAKLKSSVRKYPRIASLLQWIFDPAFTPKYLIERWVKQQGYILNFGSGSCNWGKNVINLDIEESANVHIVNKSNIIPFKNNSFDAVLLEYVIEHLENYHEILKETVRILKPGGSVLITAPFRQNYHACPQDYWRFTHKGLEALLLRVGFQDMQIEVYGGPVSSWIDATKEFLATVFSLGIPFLFDIFSQLFIIPFIPLRYLDIVFRNLSVAKYTAFSLKAIAKKSGNLELDNTKQSLEDKIKETLWVPDNYQVQQQGRLFVIDTVK